MRADTIRALNAVNRRFYQERASEFDRTRERPWEGWDTLVERCGGQLSKRPRILDVGCGNGRFARFAAEREMEPASYRGIDQSPLALEHARRRTSELSFVSLDDHDFVTEPRTVPEVRDSERFDLIVLFGVLHHVPGRQTRRRLLTDLAHRLAPGGVMAYSIWRFDQFERFRRKLVPWDVVGKVLPEPVDTEDLEPGDHIMTWGADEPAHRYCHAVSDSEAEEMLATLELSMIANFLGDGDKNSYYALARENGVLD